MSARIPVTIFSGFLGAGKTTLIGDLLRQCPSKQFAVVVNEFGAVSIDGSTLSRTTSGNTIIYNLVGRLVGYEDDNQIEPAMLEIATKGQVDHVIVETSGLAAPTAILERVSSASLSQSFIMDAVITVVDTPWLNASTALTDPTIAPVFKSQLSAADIVVLNKVDNLDHVAVENAAARVRSASPTIRFLELAHHAQLDAGLILGVHLHEPRHKVFTHAMIGSGPASTIEDGHTHSGLSAHEHGLLTHVHLHKHDPGWISFVLHSHMEQDSDAVLRAIGELARTQALLRAKGFIQTNSGTQLELQCIRQRIDLLDHSADHQMAKGHEHSGEPHRSGDEHQSTEHRHNGEHHHLSDEHRSTNHRGTGEHLLLGDAQRSTNHQHSGEHNHEELPASELVFIGHNLDRQTVVDTLNQSTGTHWS